jgi:hypothetical protein
VLYETVYLIAPLSGGETKELVHAQNIFRTGSPSFYPKRMDLFKESQENAKELGGQLQAPPLEVFVDPSLFGWNLEGRVRVMLPS